MTDVIIDGNSLYARAWYATCRDFVDVNAALRSALQTVFSLLNRDVERLGTKIDRTLFCWDGEHGRDKGDKRQEKPQAYHEGRAIIQEVLTYLLNTAHATPPAHEADDAVATAVAFSPADEVYVVSGDKDLMQLQCDSVHYFCLNTKALLTRSYIITKFGVKHPRQIAIAQAILGDKIDNIQGLKGWGPKKVKTLFEAVTPEMSFVEALNAIDNQIPATLLSCFYDSLDRTLLDMAVPGLPEPSPLVLATVEEMMECGVTGIEDAYMRMYSSYTGRRASTGVTQVGFSEDDV